MKAIKASNWILVCALGTASHGASAALYGGGPAESWTIQEIARQTSQVSGNIASFGTSFATQMQLKFEQVISAIAVATSQEALSASVVADGTRQAAGGLVNAVRAQRLSDQTARAYLSFNPATGQGYDPCGTLAKKQNVDASVWRRSRRSKDYPRNAGRCAWSRLYDGRRRVTSRCTNG